MRNINHIDCLTLMYDRYGIFYSCNGNYAVVPQYIYIYFLLREKILTLSSLKKLFSLLLEEKFNNLTIFPYLFASNKANTRNYYLFTPTSNYRLQVAEYANSLFRVSYSSFKCNFFRSFCFAFQVITFYRNFIPFDTTHITYGYEGNHNVN